MKRSIIAASALAAGLGVARAQEELHPGQPHPWQINLQEALSPIEAQIHWFSNYTLAFIIPITIFVAALLAYCAYRFNATRNPTPSRTSHNTAIEVVWTVAPVVILLFLAIPSFQLLTAQYNPPTPPELTIKATGYQWYWGYEYQPGATDPAAAGSGVAPAVSAEASQSTEATPAAEPVSFESYMLQEGDRPGSGKEDMATYPRLLTVDNEMVVPVNTVIRILATSGDVIHSFAIPSMGVKVDAVPGRNNEYWFEATREGMFYGQCSELCGRDHAFMPIGVRVVSKEQFATWLAAAGSDVGTANKDLTASIDAAAGRVAVAVSQ
ncbi:MULTISPECIES: cytochrome c oxidase subunit II [unclassified Aureimonas]|uniref:cytochrome c oxidase subunit II n=1 Tax=unclassified Aureimonas TaxID=2615206 RepID=UPI0006F3697B|nr:MULTISPECIES: cytochrome c oxidase subunit II [unclassified Aureimonas]KQT65140.1 cytochrome B [Aureimonas sp. Leaf427]KQT76333.1 cytochrome B [Aureimonas sp. Leaf460]